ncbi:MAG: hypothetical protein EOP52_11390 [Sphingobacteriales bacterium]|nr:MAG: hypothetical protein EOP52_11390 [Sphingobacteriales bacterium]
MILLLLITTSCQKAPRTHTEAEYRHRVDSAVREAIPLIQAQFDEDLDRRSSIELPPLADSLSRN